MTIFVRVLDVAPEQKAAALLRACRGEGEVIETAPVTFKGLPGSPFAYWTPPSILAVFQRCTRIVDLGCEAVTGASTKQDARFIRLKWEVSEAHIGRTRRESCTGRPWILTTRGGRFSRFYVDLDSVIQWDGDGTQAKASISQYYDDHGWGYRWNAALNGHDHYFESGLTWPLRGEAISVRLVPKGCIPGLAGKMAFASESDLPWLLALTNTKVFDSLIRLFAGKVGGVQYEAGLFNRIPLPSLSDGQRNALAASALRSWSLKRSLDTLNETSHAFLFPPGLNERVKALDRAGIERELEAIQKELDDSAFELYCIGPEDRAAIESSTKSAVSTGEGPSESEDQDPDDEEEPIAAASLATVGSWLVGVAFGRFDPRLATGERAIPPAPEPFDPLPSRSPGMYPEGDESADRPDILVDDKGHADDLATRVGAVAAQVKVDEFASLRGWLAKEFFPLHINMYSKSRRKAPIYWQLATPSASYSVWLYIHASTKDTLFRIQNDYIGGERGKLAHEERRLELLVQEIRDGGTATQRKHLATQEAIVEELRGFLDEVKRVAPLWNPNLDDGVIINFAPLWRLVPQNKSWQKELKSTWDALCEGKYDWAHLAMHLWPERVVPKCAMDRSLAIAHGLEHVFWVESTGKWEARKTATRNVEELVKERASPAVRSALTSLLEAPMASAKSIGRKRAADSEEAAVAILPVPNAVAANAWARPHTQERHEIEAAILAVLKANGAPMDRRQMRLASLLCLEPHLLASMLDKPEKAKWVRAVGGDARKAASASIDLTAEQWGPACTELRVRGRLVEDLQENTCALGTGTEAIITRGWPDDRARFVVNVLRRLQAMAQTDAIILRLPTKVQQWVALAA